MLSTRVGIALAGSGRPASLPWRPTPLGTRNSARAAPSGSVSPCETPPLADVTEPLAAGLAGVARPLHCRALGALISCRKSTCVAPCESTASRRLAGLDGRNPPSRFGSARWRTDGAWYICCVRPPVLALIFHKQKVSRTAPRSARPLACERPAPQNHGKIPGSFSVNHWPWGQIDAAFLAPATEAKLALGMAAGCRIGTNRCLPDTPV